MSDLDCNNYFDPVYQRCLSIVLSININSSIQTLTKCSFYKINVFPQPHLTLLSLSILSSVLVPNKCHFHEHIPNNLRNSTPSHLPWTFLIHAKAVVLLLESNLMSSITNQPQKSTSFALKTTSWKSWNIPSRVLCTGWLLSTPFKYTIWTSLQLHKLPFGSCTIYCQA